MDGNRCPCSELVLRQVERVTQYGENKKSDGIQDENRPDGDGNFRIFCLDDGGYGRNGTSATYGGSG